MSNGSFGGVGPVVFEGPTNVTATLGVNSPELGTRLQQGGAEYLFVYNAGGASITAGNAAILSATTGYSVTVSSVAATNDFAIGLAVATIPTANYGWLLQRGFATFETAATININGAPLAIGTDGNIVTGLGATTTTSPSPIVGKLVQTTTGGSGYGYFRF